MARLGRSFPVRPFFIRNAAVYASAPQIIAVLQAEDIDSAGTVTWIPSPPVGKRVQLDAAALIRAAFW